MSDFRMKGEDLRRDFVVLSSRHSDCLGSAVVGSELALCNLAGVKLHKLQFTPQSDPQ